MIAELKVKNLEEARDKLKKKKAEMKNRVIARDSYFRINNEKIVKIRNLNIIHPIKKTTATVNFEEENGTTSFEAIDFDNIFDFFKKVFQKPVLDIVWFGETYEIKKCRIELRSIRDSIDYVLAYGNDDELIKLLKELDFEAELVKEGIVKELLKDKKE